MLFITKIDANQRDCKVFTAFHSPMTSSYYASSNWPIRSIHGEKTVYAWQHSTFIGGTKTMLSADNSSQRYSSASLPNFCLISFRKVNSTRARWGEIYLIGVATYLQWAESWTSSTPVLDSMWPCYTDSKNKYCGWSVPLNSTMILFWKLPGAVVIVVCDCLFRWKYWTRSNFEPVWTAVENNAAMYLPFLKREASSPYRVLNLVSLSYFPIFIRRMSEAWVMSAMSWGVYATFKCWAILWIVLYVF